MLRSCFTFLSGFLLGLLVSLPYTLHYFLSIFLPLPPPPPIPPDLSPEITILDVKMATVAGVVRVVRGDLKPQDVKITVTTARKHQRQVKVFESGIEGLFIFGYSVPIGYRDKVEFPSWFGKKVKQKAKVIKFPKERFQQWAFPHMVKCEVPSGYSVIPSTRKVDNPELAVDFFIHKK